MYDRTAREVETKHGWGRFVSWSPITKKVMVEMDASYLVEYDGKDVFVGHLWEKL